MKRVLRNYPKAPGRNRRDNTEYRLPWNFIITWQILCVPYKDHQWIRLNTEKKKSKVVNCLPLYVSLTNQNLFFIWLLLYLVNLLYINPGVFLLLLYQFSSHPALAVSEQLPDGVPPQPCKIISSIHNCRTSRRHWDFSSGILCLEPERENYKMNEILVLPLLHHLPLYSLSCVELDSSNCVLWFMGLMEQKDEWGAK